MGPPESRRATLPRGLRVVAAVLGAVGGALAIGLLVGVVLPGRWDARASVRIDAPPGAVFPLVDTLALWDEWAPGQDVPSELEGPPAGVGAVRTWDDERYGRGRFQVVERRVDRKLGYRVEVEDGALVMEGVLSLEPSRGGTRVTWVERGDFGWNPLLGYVALTMDRRQSEALREGLEGLRRRVEGGGAPPSPASDPSGSGGATSRGVPDVLRGPAAASPPSSSRIRAWSGPSRRGPRSRRSSS